MKFNTFPREVGAPRKLVHNMKEYLNYINLNNGKKSAVYTTVYSFRHIHENGYKPQYESVIVDKLYFDFDDKECNAYNEANKLHQYCKQENIKHSIVMSGRGYHVYIYTITSIFKYKKDTVKGGQMFFINKLDLLCDRQVIGDICRLTRVPNTYNIKGHRFCIPLTEKQFNNGDKIIKENAVKQNFVSDVFIGEKLFNLKQFDKITESEYNLDMGDMKSSIDTKLGKLPHCIQGVLNNPNINYRGRYLAILYFKEKGYTKDEVFKILEKYLSPKKLYHCVKEERQLQYLFGRDDLIFPSCEKIKSDNQCPGKCEFHGNCIYR